MTERNDRVKIASGINVLAGLWLMLSAYILGISGTSMASNVFIIGIAVVVLSLIQAFSAMETTWPSWISGILGVWLLISPAFIVGMTTVAIWNSVILGIIVIVMAMWGAMSASSTMGHGHPKMG